MEELAVEPHAELSMQAMDQPQFLGMNFEQMREHMAGARGH
jgi:hypothetical protein